MEVGVFVEGSNVLSSNNTRRLDNLVLKQLEHQRFERHLHSDALVGFARKYSRHQGLN